MCHNALRTPGDSRPTVGRAARCSACATVSTALLHPGANYCCTPAAIASISLPIARRIVNARGRQNRDATSASRCPGACWLPDDWSFFTARQAACKGVAVHLDIIVDALAQHARRERPEALAGPELQVDLRLRARAARNVARASSEQRPPRCARRTSQSTFITRQLQCPVRKAD